MLTTLSQALLEAEAVDGLLPQDQCPKYAIDGVQPGAVALPSTVDGVSELLSLAHREGARVAPYGGGIQVTLGNLPRGVEVVLGLSSLDRMVDHQPSDLTATLEAGMSLAKAQERLAVAGQFLPLQAPCPKKATVGGILATGFSGPSGLAYGMPRDWLIGVRVANADGAVTKGGGKVVKNVTGYDLNKLYTGSLGTLGVIVEASFKLLPKPPVSRTVIASFGSLDGAAQTASDLLKGYAIPHALVLVNGEVAERLKLEGVGYWLLALFQGRPRAVEARLAEARRAAEDGGCSSLEELLEEQGNALWQCLIDLGWVGSPAPALSVRFSLLPSQTASLVRSLEAVDKPPSRHGIIADVGTGSGRSLWWPAPGESLMAPEDLAQRVTSLADEFGRRWVIERCPLELKWRLDVWGPPPDGLEIMRRVKAKLDPAGILNPGRFVGGI